MVILISGATHTGKTLLAQRLLERFDFPYLSIDHLKMGLIRSGQTDLTPEDDELLTPYLWSIVKEIIKTAIENGQNLIVEGCYIPFDWKKAFSQEYLKDIKYLCLVFDENYINERFEDIKNNANAIELRIDDSSFTKELVLEENARYLQSCKEYGCEYLLIDERYDIDEVCKSII